MKCAVKSNQECDAPDAPVARNDNERLLRLKQIIGPNGLIPVSRSTWWAGVKSGRYPQPVKLGARAVAWRASDIAALVEKGIGRCPIGSTNNGSITPQRKSKTAAQKDQCPRHLSRLKSRETTHLNHQPMVIMPKRQSKHDNSTAIVKALKRMRHEYTDEQKAHRESIREILGKAMEIVIRLRKNTGLRNWKMSK